jgi:hypothetical protein
MGAVAWMADVAAALTAIDTGIAFHGVRNFVISGKIRQCSTAAANASFAEIIGRPWRR